jgi:hypothetical protein
MPRAKNGQAPPDRKAVDVEIARLRELDVGALRARWHTVFGRRAPAHLPRHLLFRILAYRLQADHLGDLDSESQRLLDRSESPEQAGQRAASQVRRPVGTVLDISRFPGAQSCRGGYQRSAATGHWRHSTSRCAGRVVQLTWNARPDRLKRLLASNLASLANETAWWARQDSNLLPEPLWAGRCPLQGKIRRHSAWAYWIARSRLRQTRNLQRTISLWFSE